MSRPSSVLPHVTKNPMHQELPTVSAASLPRHPRSSSVVMNEESNLLVMDAKPRKPRIKHNRDRNGRSKKPKRKHSKLPSSNQKGSKKPSSNQKGSKSHSKFTKGSKVISSFLSVFTASTFERKDLRSKWLDEQRENLTNYETIIEREELETRCYDDLEDALRPQRNISLKKCCCTSMISKMFAISVGLIALVLVIFVSQSGIDSDIAVVDKPEEESAQSYSFRDIGRACTNFLLHNETDLEEDVPGFTSCLSENIEVICKRNDGGLGLRKRRCDPNHYCKEAVGTVFEASDENYLCSFKNEQKRFIHISLDNFL